ncbi:MAG: VanZ family protein [Ruminococcaceae bacterium]|nr:VanZ family protein [Oscillospiraceae bacterium]
MTAISYGSLVVAISVIWIFIRTYFAVKQRRFDLKREIQLLFVYICIVVVARFTFFPFSKVNGQIQPLIFDTATAFSPRINWIPLVNLLDYPDKRDILLNVVGNFAMFIPLGIVWPGVYKELNSAGKVISAGVGVSLLIEILQLPFYDRVSDVDDLILNSLGYITGYGIWLLVRKLAKK